MYIHRMVRTQLYLDEAIHGRLQTIARRQGRTASDLVREALLRAYGRPHADEREGPSVRSRDYGAIETTSATAPRT